MVLSRMKFSALAVCLVLVLAGICPLFATPGPGEEDDGKGESSYDEQWFDLNRERVLYFSVEDAVFRFGGHFAFGWYEYSANNARDDGFETDDARLYLEGEIDRFRLHLGPDLQGTDTPRNLYEAWADAEFDPAIHLRVGQIRMAMGSEFATRKENLPFPGYGFTSYLMGRYDSAIQAWGNLWDGLFYWEGTASAGWGFGLEGHRRENERYGLRLVWHPFANYGPDRPDWRNTLPGFFLGLAAAWSPDCDEPLVVATPLESVIFRSKDLDGRSAFWMNLESGWALGPVLIGFEDVLMGQVNDVPIGAGDREDMDQLLGWSLYAAWNITGEKTVWKNGAWAPALEKGSGWKPGAGVYRGRVELAARYANTDLDRKLFEYGYADYDTSSQETRTFSLGLNWYPLLHTRVSAAWVKTIADEHLDVFGGTTRDSSFLLGLELTF